MAKLCIFDDFLEYRTFDSTTIGISSNNSLVNLLYYETTVNVGSTNIFLYRNDNILNFAGLNGISHINITSSDTNINIFTTYYNATNLGPDGLFSDKTDNILTFKNIVNFTNMNITTDDTNIIINSLGGSPLESGTGILITSNIISAYNNSGLYISKRYRGMIYTITTASIPISTTPTNIIISTIPETGILGFTHIGDSQMKYIGDHTAIFHITSCIHSNSTDEIIGSLAINNILIPNSGTIASGLSNGYIDCIINSIYILSPNDIITTRVNRTTNSKVYDINRFWIIAQELTR